MHRGDWRPRHLGRPIAVGIGDHRPERPLQFRVGEVVRVARRTAIAVVVGVQDGRLAHQRGERFKKVAEPRAAAPLSDARAAHSQNEKQSVVWPHFADLIAMTAYCAGSRPRLLHAVGEKICTRVLQRITSAPRPSADGSRISAACPKLPDSLSSTPPNACARLAESATTDTSASMGSPPKASVLPPKRS